MRTQTKELQAKLTPRQAYQILVEGNRRFVNNLRLNRNLLGQVNETSEGQYPFAIVLSCIDSRTSAELIFDQGLGDIFSVRIAGTVLNEDILGSMEFACHVAGSRLIVVLGHTKCGAVKGACNHVELGHLTGLLSKIGPAVHEVEKDGAKLAPDVFVERVAVENTRRQMRAILER
jgi:carbonic anhydrase